MNRPELIRLLSDAEPGDVILIEQVDRLTRLDDTQKANYWQAAGHRQS